MARRSPAGHRVGVLGIPTPSLFMATNPNSTWEVVDGVQRLAHSYISVGNEKQRQKQAEH